MSRIGRMPITVPAGVTVNIAEGNVVTVKGPKGELSRALRPEMIIKQEGTTITVERPSEDKLHRSLHGLTRTLLHNMIVGVTDGYKKELDVNGVGYRVAKEGKNLVMNLGFSHQVIVSEVEGITIEVPSPNIKKVLLVTDENVFLEKAFGIIENTEVYKTNDPNNITENDEYDLYVFDNKMPEVIPKGGNILFINPSSNEFFNVLNGGEMGQAKAIKGAVSSYLENIQFTLSEYKIIETPYYGTNILTIDDNSIGFKGEVNDRKIAALSFDLHSTDFALKKEFPILIYELGEELISTGMVYKNNFTAGEKIVVKSSDFESEINVTYPNGEIKELKSGDELKGNLELGIYKINQNDNKESFSVNFPSLSESNTSMEEVGENNNIVDGKSNLKSGFNMTRVFILLAILVVAFEWIFYKKGN